MRYHTAGRRICYGQRGGVSGGLVLGRGCAAAWCQLHVLCREIIVPLTHSGQPLSLISSDSSDPHCIPGHCIVPEERCRDRPTKCGTVPDNPGHVVTLRQGAVHSFPKTSQHSASVLLGSSRLFSKCKQWSGFRETAVETSKCLDRWDASL